MMCVTLQMKCELVKGYANYWCVSGKTNREIELRRLVVSGNWPQDQKKAQIKSIKFNGKPAFDGAYDLVGQHGDDILWCPIGNLFYRFTTHIRANTQIEFFIIVPNGTDKLTAAIDANTENYTLSQLEKMTPAQLAQIDAEQQKILADPFSYIIRSAIRKGMRDIESELRENKRLATAEAKKPHRFQRLMSWLAGAKFRCGKCGRVSTAKVHKAFRNHAENKV
jgi:hypothetical protein